MSFFDIVKKYEKFDYQQFFNQVEEKNLADIISSENLNEVDFLTLLSPSASRYLEDIAQRAHQITLNYFGKTIQLYSPLYLSNYCESQCVYCGFQYQEYQSPVVEIHNVV